MYSRGNNFEINKEFRDKSSFSMLSHKVLFISNVLTSFYTIITVQFCFEERQDRFVKQANIKTHNL